MGEQVSLRRVQEWGEFEWLNAGFSGRYGGVSRLLGGVDAEGLLNLGFVPQDDPTAVVENRRRLLEAAREGREAIAGWKLAVARQVHGVEVREVTADNLDDAMVTGRGQWEADGLVTGEHGVLLGVGAADCVPLLVADVRRRAVGGFHAGWRGTAAGMVEAGLRQMERSFGTRAEDCVAAVGPSIGACCYEVGEEVKAAFGDDTVLRESRTPGKWRLDLWEANRRQLVSAGVPAQAVTVLGECTACSRDALGRRRYFSHRDEGGVTGRMLGVIGVR